MNKMQLTYFVLYDEGDEVYYVQTIPMIDDQTNERKEFIACSKFPFEAKKYVDMKEALHAKTVLEWSVESEQQDLADRMYVRKMTITYNLEESRFTEAGACIRAQLD